MVSEKSVGIAFCLSPPETLSQLRKCCIVQGELAVGCSHSPHTAPMCNKSVLGSDAHWHGAHVLKSTEQSASRRASSRGVEMGWFGSFRADAPFLLLVW